jgi:hypothetical protein
MESAPKDTDTSPLSPHHTLGNAHHQAAYGDHSLHNLGIITIIGAKGGSAILTSIVAALVALGATDGTS